MVIPILKSIQGHIKVQNFIFKYPYKLSTYQLMFDFT